MRRHTGVFDTPSLIPHSSLASVEATELRKWPLTHGSGAHPDDFASIRKDGLLAGRKRNSYAYDVALDRTDSVFFSTASFRCDYGFGCGFLIDPAILRNGGLQFSDCDIGNAYDCVRITLDDGEYCGRGVKEQKLLLDLIERQREALGGTDDKAALALIGSDVFNEYYKRFYSLTDTFFFETIEAHARSGKYSLFNYFNRTGMWPLNEEISIRGRLAPEYILGYWDGSWQQWTVATESETTERVSNWLDLRRSLGH